jgi:hypothetical protein
MVGSDISSRVIHAVTFPNTKKLAGFWITSHGALTTTGIASTSPSSFV